LIRAAILDIDGTLLDSNIAHTEAWVRALAEAGHTVSFEHIRSLIGMGGDQLLPAAIGVSVESSEGSRLAKRQIAIFRESYLSSLKPFPSARELLLRLKHDQLSLIVASSADSGLLNDLLDQAGIRDLIDDCAIRQADESSKPAPDLVEQALKIAGVHRDEAVMIGDTPYDIAAASRAGIKSIALTCGGWSAQDLKGADAIHRDPHDLLLHLSRLPEQKIPLKDLPFA
jgi:HAD superfamily hydrolase (TIGR01509 family)